MPDAPRRQHDAIARGREQARNEAPVLATHLMSFVQYTIVAVGAGVLAVRYFRNEGHWVAAGAVAVGVLAVLVRLVWLILADVRARRQRERRRGAR